VLPIYENHHKKSINQDNKMIQHTVGPSSFGAAGCKENRQKKPSSDWFIGQ
jgi:hypothetical protein